MNRMKWLGGWLLGMLLIALFGLGQQPKVDPPPVISPALATKLFKAQAQSAGAQLQEEQAQKRITETNQAMTQVIAEINSACGAKFQPQMDKDGNPVCTPKVEVKK